MHISAAYGYTTVLLARLGCFYLLEAPLEGDSHAPKHNYSLIYISLNTWGENPI